jgi:hypothetical protein
LGNNSIVNLWLTGNEFAAYDLPGDQLIYTTAPYLDSAGLILSVDSGALTYAGAVSSDNEFNVAINLLWNGTYQERAWVSSTYSSQEDVITAVALVDDGGDSAAIGTCATGLSAKALGDPQFVGFLGQRYQVHGMDGSVYSIISDPDVQINARFVFLQSGKCPRDHAGQRPSLCWSHPGSYFGSLSVLTSDGQTAVLIAGAADEGLKTVIVNGELLLRGESRGVASSQQTASSVPLVVERDSSGYSCYVSVGVYELAIESSDGFLNLVSVSVTRWDRLPELRPHGLLGQTWRRAEVKGQQVAEVEGSVDDYAEASGQLFGSAFTFSRFRLTAHADSV